MNIPSDNDFRCAGYVITRPAEASEHKHPSSIASHILSISPDLAFFVPDSWALKWAKHAYEEPQVSAARCGIPPERVPTVMHWVTARFDNHEFGWTHLFYSLDLAREFVRRFVTQTSNLNLLGIGVHHMLVSDFLKQSVPSPGMGPWGYYEMLQRGEHLASGGTPCGFEIVGLGLGALHTWRSSGWVEIAVRELGLRCNAWGLVPSYTEALRAAQHPYPSHDEEEGLLWQPWLLTRYSLAG